MKKGLILTAAALMTTLSILSTAQAATSEEIRGVLELQLLECSGVGSCVGAGNGRIEAQVQFELSADRDGNHVGYREVTVPLVDGTKIHMHVFVNRMALAPETIYHLGLTAYGNDSQRGDLFGMPRSFVRVAELPQVVSAQLVTNEFPALGGIRKAIVTFRNIQTSVSH